MTLDFLGRLDGSTILNSQIRDGGSNMATTKYKVM